MGKIVNWRGTPKVKVSWEPCV